MAIFVIPGFFTRKHYYNDLAEHFKKQGFNVQIIDLGYNVKNLEATTKKVMQYLKSTPEKDDIIAHSFGGIVLKNIIAQNPDIIQQIRSISFVSVPHHGSWATLLVPIFPATRDLMPTKKHFKQLLDAPMPKNIINFIPGSDIKIWHEKGSRLEKSIDVLVPNTNHDNIMKSKELFSRITKILNKQ